MQSWKAPLLPISSSASHCGPAPSHLWLRTAGVCVRAHGLTWSAPSQYRLYQVFQLSGEASHSMHPFRPEFPCLWAPGPHQLALWEFWLCSLRIFRWKVGYPLRETPAVNIYPVGSGSIYQWKGIPYWFPSSWSLFPSKTQEPDQCWMHRVGDSL